MGPGVPRILHQKAPRSFPFLGLPRSFRAGPTLPRPIWVDRAFRDWGGPPDELLQVPKSIKKSVKLKVVLMLLGIQAIQ